MSALCFCWVRNVRGPMVPASSGIGLATARLFAREGAKVAATGRCKEALDTLCDEISREGFEGG